MRQITIRPGVVEGATKLTVTIWVRHAIWGTIEMPL
jgi:hypothetical protein